MSQTSLSTVPATGGRITPPRRVHAKLRRAEESLNETIACYADLLSTATSVSHAEGMSLLYGQGTLEHLVAGMTALSTTRRETGLAHVKLSDVKAGFYPFDDGGGDGFGDDGGKPSNRAHVG